MIEELVFRGKTLEEALEKAGNFYGVPVSSIKYMCVDNIEDGEVRIKVTDYQLPSPKSTAHASSVTFAQTASSPGPEAPDPQRRNYRAQRPSPSGYTGGASHQPRFQQAPMERPQRRSTGRPPARHDGQGMPYRWNEDRPQRAFRQSYPAAGSRTGRPNYQRSPDAPGKGDYYQERRPPAREQKSWLPKETDIAWMSEAEQQAYKFVTDILKRMNFRIDLQPIQDQARLIFNLDGPDRNMLLMQKGALLTALQYLVNKIHMNRKEQGQKIFIDSLGYRIDREEELKEIALLSAEKVRATGKEYLLNPMNPYERRMIHLALKDDEDVTTISRGEGFIKRVCIIPRSEAAGEATEEIRQEPE